MAVHDTTLEECLYIVYMCQTTYMEYIFVHIYNILYICIYFVHIYILLIPHDLCQTACLKVDAEGPPSTRWGPSLRDSRIV